MKNRMVPVRRNLARFPMIVIIVGTQPTQLDNKENEKCHAKYTKNIARHVAKTSKKPHGNCSSENDNSRPYKPARR